MVWLSLSWSVCFKTGGSHQIGQRFHETAEQELPSGQALGVDIVLSYWGRSIDRGSLHPTTQSGY